MITSSVSARGALIRRIVAIGAVGALLLTFLLAIAVGARADGATHPAPTITGASPSSHAIAVSFTQVDPDPGSYTVTATASGQTPVTATGPRSAITVGSLRNGISWTVSVHANFSDGAGPESGSLSAMPTGPPTPVTALAARPRPATSRTLDVSWGAPDDVGGGTNLRYTLAVSRAGTTQTLNGVSSPQQVGNLINGSTYTVTVTATTSLGSSTASTTASPGPPARPSTGNITPGGGSLTVQVLPGSGGGTSVSSFRVDATDVQTLASSSGTVAADANPLQVTLGGLTDRHRYYISATAINTFGAGASSPNVVASPGTPAAPGISSVTPQSGALAVALTPPSAATGVTSYTVTATPPSGPAVSASSPSTSVQVVGLTDGTAYSVTATATNAAGEGLTASPVTAIPGPPLAPALTGATPGDTSVSVTFTPPAAGGPSAVQSFTVLATPTSGGAPLSATGAASPVTVGGLQRATTYALTVYATNAVGRGPDSAPFSPVTTGAPGAPPAPTLTPGDGSIVVDFISPADLGAGAVTGNTITATPLGGGSPVSLESFATPVTLGGLANGVVYSVTVRAHNIAGVGVSSAASLATPRTVPAPPRLRAVDQQDGRLMLTFDRPPTDGGSPVTAYVARATGAAGTRTVVGAGSPLLIQGLRNGERYKVDVVAMNVAGSSAPSQSAVAVPSAASLGVSLQLASALVRAGNPLGLSGVVRRAGEPVGGIRVAVLQSSGAGAGGPGGTVGSAVTDGRGIWRLTVHPSTSGSYQAVIPGARSATLGFAVASRLLYLHADITRRVLTVNGIVTPSSAVSRARARVRVLLLDARGHRLRILGATLANRAHAVRGVGKSVSDFRIRMGLAPGTYQLAIEVLATKANAGSRSVSFALRVI